MIKLTINTSNSNEVVVCIKKDGGQDYCERESANKLKAQTTLPLIEKLLTKHNLTVADIDEIDVERGPGSFTGLRVGVAIANALSFASLKKVNGKSLGELEIPEY